MQRKVNLPDSLGVNKITTDETRTKPGVILGLVLIKFRFTMEERMKRIEEFTKAMRELLAKMIEENPDSSSNIYKEIWGAYTAGMLSLVNQLTQFTLL